MNPFEGMLEYFKVLGNAVDNITMSTTRIISNIETITEMMKIGMVVGGILLVVLIITVIWQAVSISSLNTKLTRVEELTNRIEDMLIRRIYDEGRNGK